MQDISTAPATRESILTIPETQMAANQVIQPVQQNQVARIDKRTFIVVDDQHAGPFKTVTFTLSTVEALQPTVSCLCHRQR